MNYSKKVSENKAFEIICFEQGWPCVFDLMTNCTIGRKHDHAGFFLCLVIFGYKIIEFNFYDMRHADDE